MTPTTQNFVGGSDRYRTFRPTYPAEFFAYLRDLAPQNPRAWDAGCGTGQVAAELAHWCEHVTATDISPTQIKEAPAADNITYEVMASENTSFDDNQFDLVTVGQAIHWFDFDTFYPEVTRVTKPGGLFCVVGYGVVITPPEIRDHFTNFYTAVIGPYWDPQRHYVDDGYTTIPFPFKELDTPNIQMDYSWSKDHFLGYLSTWSAVKNYKQENGVDPLVEFATELANLWPDDDTKDFAFPLLLRVGVIEK